MNKITTKARKLKCGDRVKVAGTTYKVTSLSLSFGRTPAPKQSYQTDDYVRISLRTKDGLHTCFSLPAKEVLTVRRK